MSVFVSLAVVLTFVFRAISSTSTQPKYQAVSYVYRVLERPVESTELDSNHSQAGGLSINLESWQPDSVKQGLTGVLPKAKLSSNAKFNSAGMLGELSLTQTSLVLLPDNGIIRFRVMLFIDCGQSPQVFYFDAPAQSSISIRLILTLLPRPP